MSNIQLVDLVGQYQKIQKEIDEKIIEVVRSSAYIKGPEVVEFEKELADYLDVKHVIGCANGTDALQVAMMALGFKPGDEVITANFTYVATAEVIALLQLKPVLVDVDEDTFTLDPESVRNAITDKTVGIVPVHLYGQCSDMDPILEIAEEFNLKIIEDTAQAIGADYTHKDGRKAKAGTIGHIGTTSFFPSKNLGCMGDGGAIFTNDDQLAEKLRVISNHGQSRQYYHDEVGVNSRLDSIQAAILRIKLRHLDSYCKARQEAAAFYNEAFASINSIKTPIVAHNSTHVYHQYTLTINGLNRDDLQNYLNENGIPNKIFYPVPLHLQKAYQDPRYNEGDFPVTEKLCKKVISLPMHTELPNSQLEYITSTIKKFTEQN